MIINRVEIENFFCYVDYNEFTFDEGLNIVSAKNSGGKSHLFNAFHWTFFNNVYVDKEDDTTKKEWKSADKVITLPDHVVSKTAVDDVMKTSIKITLTAEYHEIEEPKGDLVEYHFEKEITYKKGSEDVFPISKPELLIWYVQDGETKYLERGEHRWFLDKIFPVSIRKFMWFQGETLDELYDFSRPATLNYAIKEISYFPIYENLVTITEKSVISIGKKIDSELRKQKKFSNEQERLISDIDITRKKIASYESKFLENQKELQDLTESILKEEDKLKGYDKYTQLKSKLHQYDYEIKSINDKIDSLSVLGKEKFISKWILNKCDDLIKDSTKNLGILSDELKSFQKSENPVPITLPGPEYVQKMLEDHVCYICEREVEEGSPAYEALEARMQDFRNNQIQKILADNYTELNRFKRNLLNELPGITEEVISNDNEIEKLITKRKKLIKKRENLFSDSGVENASEIKLGSINAEQILNKIRSLNTSKSSIERKISMDEQDKFSEEEKLFHLLSRKTKVIPTDESNQIVEVISEKYIDIINKALSKLKNTALSHLIEEISNESNALYTKYLGGITQGQIEIDRGVRIIDKLTKKTLTNLNTAELTAQKLAVANAFLSLSEKKMNRSFPLLADAPTSDFDDDNTLFLTQNLTDSFNQIIIMSKDYNKLKGEERSKFIGKANICKYYELKNDLIDKEGKESRTNKRTYINIIK
ncbi:AAA family ATPase [Mangrovimonas xylaniphaga]|uniref:AAA family ATPase n=1 Tax=Mangrovimonas xylaniphaga TaxID=1645915 RepID=UPI0006B5E395|nr:AAA family ATPase [Mangrovimonas xylaniphaga]